jgi:hypothetical protein
MIFDTKIPLYAIAGSVITFAGIVVKYWINQIDRTQNAWWPSERKYHSRLVGWSGVTVCLV